MPESTAGPHPTRHQKISALIHAPHNSPMVVDVLADQDGLKNLTVSGTAPGKNNRRKFSQPETPDVWSTSIKAALRLCGIRS